VPVKNNSHQTKNAHVDANTLADEKFAIAFDNVIRIDLH